MKITRLELVSLAVTALALLAMLLWLRFPGGAADSPVLLTTEKQADSSAIAAGGDRPPAGAAAFPEDSPFPIDLNTAAAEELMLLPGIGETRAQAIVAFRAEHGPFTYVEDLREVEGIGEGILADIMDYVTVSGGTGNG